MKKVHLGLILSVMILFSYQNCQKPPYKETSSINSTDAIILADENIQKITFIAKENTTVQQSSKVFTLISQNSYAINYETGEILVSSEAIATISRYCLSSNLLAELHDILLSAKVCKTENVPVADRVCAAVYQNGYAQLITNRDVIDLGWGMDGCATNKIDLCDATSSDMLKGWFVAVKNALPQQTCPN